MMPLCQAEGVGVIPWSPLARGRLARPLDRQKTTSRAGSDEFGNALYKKTEEDGVVINRVSEIAAARGIPMAHVALAWQFSKPFVTSPIVGATKPDHLQDAVAAMTVKLTAEEIAKLEEPYVPHAIVGFE
jgi:aryl-alcohol dehydrogenase-like predicted oxidoreductase